MTSRPNHGRRLEEQFLASLPPRVYAHKLHSAGPAGAVVHRVRAALKGRMTPQLSSILKGASFSPTSPFDVIVLAPYGPAIHRQVRSAVDGEESTETLQPALAVCLELKSTAAKSLPHQAVRDHQVQGMLDAQLDGHLAGLILDFRDIGEGGETYFIPARSYAAYRRAKSRKSFPVAAARLGGMRLQLDTERGRTRRYWLLGEWLERIGATI